MAEILRMELVNCENRLLSEIADRRFTRRDVAQTYCLAMRSGEKVDWAKVNNAIVERWSHFGLEWIRRQANSEECFEPRRSETATPEIPLAVQVKAVEREIALRKAVYPKRIAAKSMKRETADHEIAAMEAVLETLRGLERRTEACPDGCEHSDAEHVAFDAGVAAGARGDDEESGPYGPDDLREAWLAGYSVGSMNRENSNESTANNGD